MVDYRVEPDGTAVALLSERSAQRGTGPKPKPGWRMVFKTKRDTAQFVRAGEAEGYSFEGKENLGNAL
jgi:hypothetical protein